MLGNCGGLVGQLPCSGQFFGCFGEPLLSLVLGSFGFLANRFLALRRDLFFVTDSAFGLGLRLTTGAGNVLLSLTLGQADTPLDFLRELLPYALQAAVLLG